MSDIDTDAIVGRSEKGSYAFEEADEYVELTQICYGEDYHFVGRAREKGEDLYCFHCLKRLEWDACGPRLTVCKATKKYGPRDPRPTIFDRYTMRTYCETCSPRVTIVFGWCEDDNTDPDPEERSSLWVAGYPDPEIDAAFNVDVNTKTKKEKKDSKKMPLERKSGIRKTNRNIFTTRGPYDKRMDTEGKELKVSDVIVFDEDASFHRHHNVFAEITKVSKTGRLTVRVLPRMVQKVEIGPTLSVEIVTPDLTPQVPGGPSITGYLSPKRGKQAGDGYYRWNQLDVLVFLYDASKTYRETNCY